MGNVEHLLLVLAFGDVAQYAVEVGNLQAAAGLGKLMGQQCFGFRTTDIVHHIEQAQSQ